MVSLLLLLLWWRVRMFKRIWNPIFAGFFFSISHIRRTIFLKAKWMYFIIHLSHHQTDSKIYEMQPSCGCFTAILLKMKQFWVLNETFYGFYHIAYFHCSQLVHSFNLLFEFRNEKLQRPITKPLKNSTHFVLFSFVVVVVRYRLNDNSHCLFDVCDFIPILNGYLFGWTIRVSVKVICCQYKICMHLAHGILCDELIYWAKHDDENHHNWLYPQHKPSSLFSLIFN